MNKVLYAICWNDVSLMDSWHPFPSTALAMSLGCSLYFARKELKKLKELGLVESCRECSVTEYGNYILNGYRLTEKARETEEYKTALKKEREIRKKCFGDIF